VAERGPPEQARQRTTGCWLSRAQQVTEAAGLGALEREPLVTHSRIPPWRDGGGIDIRPDLIRPVSKKKHTDEYRKQAALDTLAQQTDVDVDACTDGSVLLPRSLGRGGGGYVCTDADGQTHRGKCAAGRRCTSYRAELCAMIKLLDDLLAGKSSVGTDEERPFALRPRGGEQGERGFAIRICLDSRSAIQRLARGPAEQTGELEMRAWERLLRLRNERGARSILIQYVPGHVDLEQQEEADVVAKDAAQNTDQTGTSVNLDLAKAILRSEQRPLLRNALTKDKIKKPEDHLWLRAMGEKVPDHSKLSRPQQCILSRLRAGRSVMTNDIAHRFSGKITKVEVPAAAEAAHCGLTLKDRIIAAVGEASPATKAKPHRIRAGWLVEKVDGTAVGSDAETHEALRACAGRTVRLHLRAVPSDKCSCGAVDSTEHLFSVCDNEQTVLRRNDCFGATHPPLTVLRTHQKQCLKFLRLIGRLSDKDRHTGSPAGDPEPPSAAAGGGANGLAGGGGSCHPREWVPGGRRHPPGGDRGHAGADGVPPDQSQKSSRR